MFAVERFTSDSEAVLLVILAALIGIVAAALHSLTAGAGKGRHCQRQIQQRQIQQQGPDMFQYVVNEHTIEMRQRRFGVWMVWTPVFGRMFDCDFDKALSMVLASRLYEGLQAAYDAVTLTHGTCADVQFRVRTSSTTLTFIGNPTTQGDEGATDLR